MRMAPTYPISRRALISFLAAILILNIVFWQKTATSSSISIIQIPTPTTTLLKKPHIPPDLQTHQNEFWQHLHTLLTKHAPNCSSPILNGSPELPRFDPTTATTTANETPRQNYVANAEDLLLPMQTAHDGFVAGIGGMSTTALSRLYVPGTEGIVSAAGGRYLPVFVVSLIALRRTGCRLPVELFVRDWEEYEPYVCEVVLGPLGGRCVVLSEVLEGDGGAEDVPITHFQIKPFAMLFSSFQSLIWMDADTLLLHDPTDLLNTPPFSLTGLLTWPDFWSNTVSPLYYKITRQHHHHQASTSQSTSTTTITTITTQPNQSTDSSLLLLSKSTHLLPLLLATYYNYHGPSHYYRLFSQGAPGEGDKDTYLQAAIALNTPFYAVSEPVADLGLPAPDGGVWGAAMLQADPGEDYVRVSSASVGVSARERVGVLGGKPRGFFVNANNPAFDPAGELLGVAMAGGGRLWTAKGETLRRVGFDAEKMFWEVVLVVSCELERAFESWKGRRGSLCGDVRRHWMDVFEDSRSTAMFRQIWSSS